MPADDWALGQNMIDVQNEGIRARHGYAWPDPEADWIAMLADDPDLHLVQADLHSYAEAHPCDCEGTCVCESRAETLEDT